MNATRIVDMGTGLDVTEADGTVRHVPKDPRNLDYQAARKWEAAGGTVEAAPAKPVEVVTDQSIERRVALQMRNLALQEELATEPADADRVSEMLSQVQRELAELRK